MYISKPNKSLKNERKINFILFPPAGMISSSLLRYFGEYEKRGHTINIFDYPTRGIASNVPAVDDFNQLCIILHQAMQCLLDCPIVIIGHSFGGYVAVELARLLQIRQNIAPISIILSSVSNLDMIHNQKYLDFIQEDDSDILDKLGVSIPDFYYEMKSSVIHWIKSDIKLLATYKYTPFSHRSKIFIFNGDSDQHILRSNNSVFWGNITEDKCEYKQIKAGHSFNKDYYLEIAKIMQSYNLPSAKK